MEWLAAYGDRAGAPPGALVTDLDVDDGMRTTRQYVAWPRGWLMGCARARFGSTLGPRLCGASAARSAASRRRRQALRFGERAPSPAHQGADPAGLCATVGPSGIRRLSALENCWRRARGTASGSVPGRGGAAADPGELLLRKCHQPNGRIAVFGPAQAHFLPDETRDSVAFDFFDHRCANEQFQLRLQPDHPPGEVFDLRLLHLHRVGLAVHLVFHLDHGRERAPDLVGDAHQAALPDACLASMAAIRWLLASMKSSASSMAAPARSAAALAASAKAPKAASASPDWYAKAPRRINSDIGMSSFFALATMLFLSCALACTTIRCTADVIESAPENVDMDSICTWTAYVHRRTRAGQPCA